MYVAYSSIPEFRECVNDDTKDNVEADGGNNDEEGYVEEEPSTCFCSLFRGNIAPEANILYNPVEKNV